jgi:TldD protein
MNDDVMLRRRDLLLSLAAASLATACGKDALPKAASAPTGAQPDRAPPVGSEGLVLAHFGAFGVDASMLREGLAAALSKGADRAELYFEHRVWNSVSLEDGDVNRAFTGVELGVGIRAIKGDQVGYGYTEELTLDSVRRTGQTAAAIASGPAKSAPHAFKVGTFETRYPVSRPWKDVTTAERIPLLQRVNERAFASDARIKNVKAYLNDTYAAILVVTSDGRVFEDLLPITELGVSCVAEHQGRSVTNGHGLSKRRGMELYTDASVDGLVREAVARTTVLFEASPPPLGEMQVVLAAGASGILLHEAIGHGMEADFNRKNTSIYADKIGKPIAKDFVTIVDDGTLPNERGSINIDDEGNLAGKTVLVEGGVLATYMHDSISAKHYGVAPTGSARRESFRAPPMPRMRATYMLPGPHDHEEIVRSVKRGIYCSTFGGGQVEIGAGDFTFFVKNGFLIEDGKLTRPITDVNLIGNGPKVLERVDMVAANLKFDDGTWTCGKRGQSVPVSMGIPTVRIAEMTVGGRGGGKA